MPSKPALDAVHQVLNGRFNHLVVDASSGLTSGEKAAVLHHAQVFRCDGAWNAARLGDLAHGQLALKHQLDHSESHGMGQGA